MTTSSNIVGVSGTFASGKDTLAHMLEDKLDWLHVSAGDLIRHETQRLFGKQDRKILHEYGNQMRREQGAGILVEMAIKQYEENKAHYDGLVISGIRSIGEAQAVKDVGGTMIFVDADIRIRYDRATGRQRNLEDQMSFEDFKNSEAKEMAENRNDPTKFNIAAIREMSDAVIMNDGDIKAFETAAFKALKLEPKK